MSTPAVRIAVTQKRANTNVINTSALTPGSFCVSDYVRWVQESALRQLPNGYKDKLFHSFSLRSMALFECSGQ